MATSQPRGGTPSQTPPEALAKVALRDQLNTARNRLTLAEIGLLARDLADHVLGVPEVRRAATVAAYVSVGAEPGTAWILDGLRAAGTRVVLPVLLPDGDLDWAAYDGESSLAPARYGLLEPTGRRLGVEAISTPDVVLVPGLAVSPTGLRMGKGRGCYDRALGRVPVGTFTAVLLYDDEVGLAVPAEPHDRSVTAAITPTGMRHF